VFFRPFKELFEYLESIKRDLVNGQSETGSVVVEIDAAVLRLGLPLKDVPEQFVTHFHIDDRKIFRHRGIQAGHDDVVVVHLPGMRNYRYGMGFGQGGDFAGLRDAAHAVGIELDVIDRPRFQQVAEAVKREFMFTARQGIRP
jgi:hypothetical protein